MSKARMTRLTIDVGSDLHKWHKAGMLVTVSYECLHFYMEACLPHLHT